jgi:hypothetical protein
MLVCRSSGQLMVISSPAEARTLLTTRWPVTSGRAFFRALEVFTAVAEGTRTLEDARMALLDAADEAGVPVAVSA